ncbi:hypothetical protein ACWZEH_16020 [Streptomyces sp. QTS137]
MRSDAGRVLLAGEVRDPGGVDRTPGEARGWSRRIADGVDRAPVIVLSGQCEGGPVRYSGLSPNSSEAA